MEQYFLQHVLSSTDDTLSSVFFSFSNRAKQGLTMHLLIQRPIIIKRHLFVLHFLFFCWLSYIFNGYRFDSQYNYLKMKAQPLTLLLLIWLVHSDGTITETHVDLVGSCLAQGSALLKRMQKKVDVRYAYTLNSLNEFYQFPDMAIQFSIGFDQYVFIKYHITAKTDSPTYLITRVLIDSQENWNFRVISGGDLYHHTNSQSEQVWLTKGKHFVKVEYRTPVGTQNNPGTSDWRSSIFYVRYYEL